MLERWVVLEGMGEDGPVSLGLQPIEFWVRWASLPTVMVWPKQKSQAASQERTWRTQKRLILDHEA